MDETLQWNGVLWHGHTERFCMSMGQETFQRYLAVYRQGLKGRVTPSEAEAMHIVSRLAYWTYARYDRSIRFVQLPGCILKEEGKEHE